MTCKLCKERVKSWGGDNPRCAFTDGGEYSTDNWNCATVNEIRSITYEGGKLSRLVDYRYCSDQKYATIKIDDCDIEDGPLALWLTWYKNRGATGEIWLLFDGNDPRRPTENDLLEIIRYVGIQ